MNDLISHVWNDLSYDNMRIIASVLFVYSLILTAIFLYVYNDMIMIIDQYRKKLKGK